MFQRYKKELAEENFWKGEKKVLDFDLTHFNKFIEEHEVQDRLRLVNAIKMEVPEPENEYNNLGTSCEKHTKYFYNSFVKRFRPKMIKETPKEFDYDFDFDIDEKNYDPWQEYKKVYRDVLTRGRAYWIIKSFPEWFFLQVGKPSPIKQTNVSRYNPKRPDMEDSIFNTVMLERYFDERNQKMNLYNGYSHTIKF